MNTVYSYFVLLCCLLITQACEARWARPQLENVPIERLITNLEKQIQVKTNDAEFFYALARVHSMAYAAPTSGVDVKKENGLPYFGFHANGELPPLEPKETGATNQAAKAHLKQAIAFYTKAIQIKPDHAPSQLGLGWSLDQAGDKKAALEAYRKALQLSWQEDNNKKRLYGGQSMTEETVDYMLPLLDPTKDAAEIETITKYKTTIHAKPRFVTPILIPLEEDTTDLESLVDHQAKVQFDLDGSLPRAWGWITPKAGWLVYDHTGSGKISSGLQMLGSVTFWIFWENGYQALASLDDDHDGQLSGAELKGLALWQDQNSNGISDPGEVNPLKAFGISALSVHCESHQTGIPFHPEGVTFDDGTTRPSYDWIARSESK